MSLIFEEDQMKKKYLVLLAGILWIFAGVKVVMVGCRVGGEVDIKNFWYYLIMAAVFLVFYFRIFSPMVDKNLDRISKLEEPKLWKFLDKKSYIIMFGMMFLGMALRKFTSLPPAFFYTFYIGLGMALLSAGIKYMVILVKIYAKKYFL